MGWDVNQLPPDLAKRLGIDKQKRAKSRELERVEQVSVINWARDEKPYYPVLKLLYAVPNGGLRNPKVAAKLKAEGVLAGVFDLCLPAARRGYHGLYIEMKYGDNGLTPAQETFRDGLRGESYCVAVCYSADEAQATLRWYIGMSQNQPKCILN